MCIFCSPGNGQALLGMPETAALKLININTDSIQAEVLECKTNIEQEMHAVEKGCANTDADLKPKQGTNGQTAKTMQTKQLINFSHHLM